MPAPEELGNLINNFDNHIDELKSNDYKEMSLCTDYLNPLFKLLGWDVDNYVGKAEKFRDVIQQYRLTIGGSSKAPDYLFKIGNTGVFFVEAKKPSVDIAKAKDPAFQLRRYGWNKKEIDVSILTDFETFSVYDCRLKPNADDDPRVGRMAMYTYKDYATKWDELYSLFARENVEKGSLDKLLKEGTVKGVKESVDETFLKMIEEWRELLARNIALRNENLDVRGLNFAVQQTIDRIIFLRIAEDRGLESPNQLQALTNHGSIYDGLIKLYELADSRYNSGLFHFKSEKGIDTQPDTISMSLSIDDKVLKDMITNLYYPKSPFDFSAMPADILGQVYERFLGKVIRLTGGHQAKVEEKPEVRKAGGVYYTPTYIVDYIVQNTVGKLVEGKTPEQVAKLRILDPACGSGSFLIGAYQFLLDWHLDWYISNDRDKWIKGKNPPICEQMSEGQRIFRLTTEKRKEILKNNIYGVDIDRQAVEVAKLNLLLKVLEQENNPDLFKHNQRALPDLGSNIKCGNSLIGMDFYTGKEDLFNNPEETWRINAMDWDVAFPAIVRFKDKEKRELEDGFGFDAVIGNPPYVFTRDVDFGDNFKEYVSYKYINDSKRIKTKADQSGKINLFVLFIITGLRLLKNTVYMGIIVPNNVLRTTTYDLVRKYLLENTCIIRIVDHGSGVFNNVTASTVTLIIQRNKSVEQIYKNEIGIINNITNLKENKYDEYFIKQYQFNLNTSYTFNIYINDIFLLLNNKIRAISNPLGANCKDIIEGVVAHKYLISNEKNENNEPMIDGKSINRYSIGEINKYIYWDVQKIHRTRPQYLWDNWCKIVIQRISGGNQPLKAAIDFNRYKSFASVNNIVLKSNAKCDYYYLLGMLNSKTINWFYANNYSNNSKLTVNVSKTFLEQLPIRTIDFANKSDVEKHDKMVALVDTMLELNKRLRECSVPSDTEMIKRQIEHTDRQIDQLVYELYGLTDDEIRIVEESFADNKKK